MTLQEIKDVVRNGRKVHWSSKSYEVILHNFTSGEEQWLIKFIPNGHCIGLTWEDGVTMNGKEEDFFTS